MSEDRLKLVREISRSGIATVWEAYDAVLDRKVLLKAIHPQFARESDLRARFEREAKAIARLRHACVVQIYDVKKGPDELSLMLEFIEGQSLGNLLKEHGSLPLEAAFTITMQILSGLEHAHAEGIIHRDLKPDNVLISNKGEVKITDFGLATLKDQPTVTMDGMVVGTPSYMAPEQAGGGEVTVRTDLFAVGLMLFEMLTGQRVIAGATLTDAFQNALNYAPPKFDQYRDTIPESLVPVLIRLLEKNPDKRFATASETSNVLTALLPEALLPPPLLHDYLSGNHDLRPAHKKVVTSRVRPRWLQRSAILALVLIIIGLAYYLGTLISRETADTIKPSHRAKDSTQVVYGPDYVDTISSTQKPLSDTIPSKESGRKEKEPEQPPQREPAKPVEKPVVLDTVQTGTGYLRVQCKPWADVFIRDSLWKNCDICTLALASGTYPVSLMNSAIRASTIRMMTIKPNTTVDLNVNLYDYVAKIKAVVKPGGDLYIDDSFEFKLPSNKIVYKPLGKHVLRIKHPNYQDYTKEVIFQQGDSIYEFRVDLTQMDSLLKK